MNEGDQQFLEYVVKNLVDNPEAVKVARKTDEMGVLLTLDVNAADMGKVIGRSGNTAKAIRILLRVVGMKGNARVNLKINEPAGGPMSGGVVVGADTSSMPMPHDRPTVHDRPHSDRPSASKSIDEALDDLKLD